MKKIEFRGWDKKYKVMFGGVIFYHYKLIK